MNDNKELFNGCISLLKEYGYTLDKDTTENKNGCKLKQKVYILSDDKLHRAITFLKVGNGEWYINMYSNWSVKVKNAGKYIVLSVLLLLRIYLQLIYVLKNDLS